MTTKIERHELTADGKPIGAILEAHDNDVRAMEFVGRHGLNQIRIEVHDDGLLIKGHLPIELTIDQAFALASLFKPLVEEDE